MEQPRPVEDREVLLEDENEDDQPGRDVIIMFAVFFEGGLAPLSLLLGWWLGHNPLAQFDWTRMDALWGALAAVPLVLVFLLFTLHWPIGPLRQIKTFCEEEFIAPAGGEFLVGHGLDRPLRRCRRGDALPWSASKLTGSLAGGRLGSSDRQSALRPVASNFDALHCCYGVVGLWLGGVFLLTGNLLTVIVTHSSYDFAPHVLSLAISLPRRSDQPDPTP